VLVSPALGSTFRNGGGLPRPSSIEGTSVTHGPDFLLGLCTVVGAVAGVAIGFYTGWLFPSAAAGLAMGLAVGNKLNPDDVGHSQH
jgi:H+/Cl- antiporter ClcA